MSVQWLSINDVKRLVKQKLYRLETGSRNGDLLVYDRSSRDYVGHVESAGSSSERFHQDSHYVIPQYIIKTIQAWDGSGWNNCSFGWGDEDTCW